MRFKRLHYLSLVLLISLVSRAGFAAQGGEYEVKAAFLYNFALFTEWPRLIGEFNICVLGQSPILAQLDRFVGRDVQGRTVAVRQVATAEEGRSCQVLFIAAAEHGRMAQIHSSLETHPILTVSEANGFDRSHCLIVMTPAQNRVAFEINQTAAKSRGLRLSSKLLRLASRIF